MKLRLPYQASLYAALLFLCASIAQAADSWTGEVIRVLDGDTVEVLRHRAPVRIRLANIDAPERSQAFGSRSREYLASMTYRKTVRVEDQGKDRYGRTIAVLYAGGQNINAEMVSAGMAWVYTRYSTDLQLPALEQFARENRIGLWKDSNPVEPWSFRSKK